MTIEETHPVKDDVTVKVFKGALTAQVPESAVPDMLKEGWLTHSADDIPGLVTEVQHFAGQVAQNIDKFAKDVVQKGHIDTADGALYSASLTARKVLDERIESLLRVVHGSFPMKQGEPIQMTSPEGGTRQVDPSQVEEFKAQGFKEDRG